MNRRQKEIQQEIKEKNNEITDIIDVQLNDYTIDFVNDYILDYDCCDLDEAIWEFADGYTPIYYGDIDKMADELGSDLDEAIQDGINEGLIVVNNEDFSLNNLKQQGEFYYIQRQIYENYDELKEIIALQEDINDLKDEYNEEASENDKTN